MFFKLAVKHCFGQPQLCHGVHTASLVLYKRLLNNTLFLCLQLLSECHRPALGFKFNMFGINYIGVGQSNCSFQYIFKFADIAGPAVADELAESFARQVFFAHPVFFTDVFHQIIYEEIDILAAFSQRRQFQRKGTEPVIKVLSEPALCSFPLQVPVGCGDYTHVHRYRQGGTDAGKGFVLNYVEKLGLD